MFELLFCISCLIATWAVYEFIIKHQFDEKEFTQHRRPKTSAEIDKLFEIDENDLEEIRSVFHNQRRN